MQRIIKTSFLLIAIVTITSCGSKKTTLEEKRETLEKLMKEQAETSKEIKYLEKEIAKLDTTKKEEQAKLVVLDTIRGSDFTHFIELQGKVDATDISYVTPRGGGGQVRAIYIKEGDYIRKGQLLMKLDDAIINQNVMAARQSMAATKNQLDLARNLYQRTKNIWDQHIGTEVQVLQAKTNVDVLENQLKTQQENLKSAIEQLSTSNVISNVSGVADEVNIHAGELFTGSPLAGIKIVNTASLKVVTEIPENYLSRVSKGTPVLITVPDVNKSYFSKINLISQSINASSKSFMVEAKIPYDKVLKPNLTTMIKIQDYNAPNALTIPVNTLQTDELGKFVLVAVKEGNKTIARKKQVQIGELYGDRLEVKSGLNAGDLIITEGYQNLYDGQTITTATLN